MADDTGGFKRLGADSGFLRTGANEQAPAKKAEPQSITGDASEFIKSIPSGAVQTAGDIARSEQIESEQRAMAFTDKPNAGPQIPTGHQLVQAFGMHEPQGFWGEAGQLTGEFAINPATYFGPGSAVTKFLMAAGAVFGGAAGKIFGGTLGELTGAIVGAASPGAALKITSPILMNTARQAATSVLESEGINAITAGQRTGSKALEYWEGYLGDAPFAGGKATASRETAGRQFTRAALRRAGVNADLATPQVIDGAFTRIGGEMDAIAARTNVRMDTKFVNDLLSVNDEYNLTVQEGSRRPVIQKTVDDFLTRLQQSPTLTGDQAQNFRSRLLRLQRGAFNDPEYSSAIGDIVNAMDGVIQRSIGNPADLQAWQLARRQYKNLIPLAQASTGAGEAAAEGIITPAKLRQALTSSQRGRREYARGRGDFSALTHAGNLVMTPLPNSGTAQREMARAFASALGAAGGYLVTGGGARGVGGAAIGAAAAPGALGRGIMTPIVQDYLGGRFPGQAAANAARKQMPSAPLTVMRATAPIAAEQSESISQMLQ